jgi:LmbE family N-acetylglucosaminyl deacetylase
MVGRLKDAGLAYLRLKYRAHPFAFMSPFTRETHPPKSEIIIPETDYTGHDLTREIERVIADFRPNLVATTPAEVQHPDHNSTYFFVKAALGHWSKAACGNFRHRSPPASIRLLSSVEEHQECRALEASGRAALNGQ